MKYPDDFIGKIICGDTLTELKKFPSDSIDTIITSPPYWGLRDYGVKGQIGLEKTLDEYLNKLLQITSELKRVLKPSGVMFWNHGDSYASSGKVGGDIDMDAGMDINRGRSRVPKGSYPTKCLMLQNYRLILKMIDQGWILRNTIIWHKPNHMPSSVKDRFSNSYEPVFMLVKNKKYWFDLDAVRKPHSLASVERNKYQWTSKQRTYSPTEKRGIDYRTNPIGGQTKIPQDQAESFGSPRARYHRNKDPRGNDKGGPGSWRVFKEDNPNFTNPAGKNPGDLWRIPTAPFPEAHFATFPQKLVEPMIKAGCPLEICKDCGMARERISKKEYSDIHKSPKETDKLAQIQDIKSSTLRQKIDIQTIGWTDCKCGKGWRPGIILDPFMGSGTVALAARYLKRNYIGIELNEDYIKITNKRLSQQSLGL